jgi:hypothetical protein
VSVQVSIEVHFPAKVRKNHPGRQAGFLRELRHFNAIGHLRGALREQEVRGSNPRAPTGQSLAPSHESLVRAPPQTSEAAFRHFDLLAVEVLRFARDRRGFPSPIPQLAPQSVATATFSQPQIKCHEIDRG